MKIFRNTALTLIFTGSLLAGGPALSAEPPKQLGVEAPPVGKKAGVSLPGFYRPAGDSVDAYDRVHKRLVYKTTFDKYSCIKVTEHWPDEAYAKTSVRKDANRPAIISFMPLRNLEPALYCSADGLYSPPAAKTKQTDRQAANNDAMSKEPLKGVISLQKAARVYDRQEPGGRTLAIINKGDCVLVKEYLAATEQSLVVIRDPRNPQGPLIEGYVVRLQTNRARNCVL